MAGTEKKEKRVDLFTLKKKSSTVKPVREKPDGESKKYTVKEPKKTIAQILADAEGKNTGYEWEDYLRVCEYYEKHPKAEIPNRPETLGKGHYPMREIVAFTKRSNLKQK